MEGCVFGLVKDLVKSAVEKIGCGLLSCIVDQWKENASRDDNMEWFKIVLCDLEAVLEETSDLPITSIPLRRQLKYFKVACKDWRDQVDHEEMGQAVTASSSRQLFWERHRIFPAPFINMKCLTSEDVKKVEKFVVKARELVAKVAAYRQEKISNNPHPMSLVIRLLEGESIRYYETRTQGGETRSCWIRPVRLQDRGVEAALQYKYSDPSRPGKDFAIQLFLRLRESTDILGVAIECFESLSSQSKLLHYYQSAISELKQLREGSHDTIASWRAPRKARFESGYEQSTLKARPDPFCCEDKVDALVPCAWATLCKAGYMSSGSSEISDMLPEEVILFDFSCTAGAAVSYNFGSTSSGKIISSRNRPEACMPPLEVNLGFIPHGKFGVPHGFVELEEMGGKKHHRVRSLQEFLQIVGSNATECFAHQPQLTKYRALWRTNHGVARIVVEKSKILEAMHTFDDAVKQWANDPEMNNVLEASRMIVKKLSGARLTQDDEHMLPCLL